MFVFDYFKDHLLRLAQKDLPINTTKRILKDALRGLAELHDQDVVHTGKFPLSIEVLKRRSFCVDMKADNILIDWEDHESEISVRRV